MGLLLWPLVIAALIVWSLLAWVLYGLSDGAAALLGAAFAGLLSADLGPWAAWALASLGDVLQFAVVLVWAVISLVILATPILLRRRRRAGHVTTASGIQDSYRYSHSDDDRDRADRSWRGQEPWRQRLASGTSDLRALRELANEMVERTRRRKKKRYKYDD